VPESSQIWPVSVIAVEIPGSEAVAWMMSIPMLLATPSKVIAIPETCAVAATVTWKASLPPPL
jgi:hypothetical protein